MSILINKAINSYICIVIIEPIIKHKTGIQVPCTRINSAYSQILRILIPTIVLFWIILSNSENLIHPDYYRGCFSHFAFVFKS